MFSKEQVIGLDQSSKWSIALDGTKYLPGITDTVYCMYHIVYTLAVSIGIVGLNNIKANDYMNVILHALAHAGPFRDFLLRVENYSSVKPPPGDQTITLGTHVQY